MQRRIAKMDASR